MATGGYIKEDSTGVIRQYHRLILTPVPNSSNNSYYALDTDGNNILTDGLQFNTKWSGSGDKIYPYTLYTEAFISADSSAPNELGQDSTGGNWLYDLKNGVIFFPDYSSTLCNGTTNKPVFSFYKYICRKGVAKQIDFKNSLSDIPSDTKKYDKQIVVQTSDNTIHRFDSSTSSWVSIGGSGNSDISFNSDLTFGNDLTVGNDLNVINNLNVSNDLFSDKLKSFSNEIIYQGNKLITNNDLIVETKLLASDGNASDNFGNSVAISGNYAIVGAYFDDSYKGSAYIFERDGDGNWTETKKLLASDGASEDYFGNSVAISGNYAIVGADGNDDNGGTSGSAYIFERDNNGNWNQKTKLLASDGASNDRFGRPVAISGNYVIVGADGDDDNGGTSGSAYIFERDNNGNWNQKTKLLASDGASNDYFGNSVAISGNYAIVGAYYNDDKGTDSGAAYIFERDNNGIWSQKTKLLASDGASSDYFGRL